MVRTTPCVLVADDHQDTRNMLTHGLRCIGCDVLAADCGKEALRLAAAHHPDLALLDVVMPGPSGMQLAALLREQDPAIEIVIVTAHSSVEHAVEAMRRGACYYMSKPLNMSKLLAVVEEACVQRQAPAVPGSMGTDCPVEADPVGLRELSRRERDVLETLSKGKTDEQIAQTLELSVYTVRTHMRNILHKLDLKNRLQAALFWTWHGNQLRMS
jgi:two-component system nitrate/nitrite response regulator NarL